MNYHRRVMNDILRNQASRNHAPKVEIPLTTHMIDGHIYRPRRWFESRAAEYLLGLIFLVSFLAVLGAIALATIPALHLFSPLQ